MAIWCLAYAIFLEVDIFPNIGAVDTFENLIFINI